MAEPMKSPIAIITFNRPEHVSKMLHRLRDDQDRDLYIISDGPRGDRPLEIEKVQQCRTQFESWRGRKYYNFADSNMGCKARVSTGLTWVFQHTDRVIVLEDDCIPHPSFLRFADEMLQYYENDPGVMSVCGTNLFPTRNNVRYSYFFSKYQNCWGWATWKRSWDLFDINLTSLEKAKKDKTLFKHLGSRRAAYYWRYILGRVKAGRINSWAYIWTFTAFVNGGVHIIPRHNLIQNSGFGADSTHTLETPEYVSNVTEGLVFPLMSPPEVSPDSEYDNLVEDTVFSKSLSNRISWLTKKIKSWFVSHIPGRRC